MNGLNRSIRKCSRSFSDFGFQDLSCRNRPIFVSSDIKGIFIELLVLEYGDVLTG